MICYRDRTFCPFDTCASFSECDRAYTPAVQADALKWWGEEGAPVALWSGEPGCYVVKTEDAK